MASFCGWSRLLHGKRDVHPSDRVLPGSAREVGTTLLYQERAAAVAMNHTEHTSRKRGGGFKIALLIAAVPVLYFLSFGPAIRCFRDSSPIVLMIISVVYAPLFWLWDNTSLDRLFDWYLNLWLS